MDASHRLTKYHEGWLESKTQDGERWANYWCVLRNNMLFFFLSSNTTEDMHIGTLTITSESRLTKQSGSETTGYPFDLYTRNRCNRFRTRKFYERELWKAYIEGISQGFVPENIDLPPDQITQIRRVLGQNPQHFNMPPNDPRQAPSDRTGFDSPNSSDSGFFNIPRPVVREDEYLPPVDFIESDIKESSTRTQMYRFCSEQAGNAVPSWFYFRCSREDAEEILTHGKKYGNTIMRVSSANPHSLVISKRVESTNPPSFIHYRVIEQSEGYSLDVINDHSPMGTLSDVMDFFVKTAGKSTTVPMTSNDLRRVLERSHDYGNFIKTTPGPVDAIPSYSDSEEEYVGPPSVPAPPPPPQFKQLQQQTTPGRHGLRSMSVPVIPQTDLPQNIPGSDQPPPLPPNHPSARRGSGQLSHGPLIKHHSMDTAGGSRSLSGSVQSLNTSSPKAPSVPSSAVPPLKSATPRHHGPTPPPNPAIPPPPPLLPTMSSSSQPKPPPIPSSPVPSLNTSKAKKGIIGHAPTPTQMLGLKSSPSHPSLLEVLLEKDRQKLAVLSTNSPEYEPTTTSPTSSEATAQPANATVKPQPQVAESKPEKKVPSVASPQFLEILNRQISGAFRPAPSDGPQQTSEADSMYENLDKYQNTTDLSKTC